MARLLEFLVPGVGIEPTTQGSSGLRSTTELSRLTAELPKFVSYVVVSPAVTSPYIIVRLGHPRRYS